jgi:hypothetical protein
MDDERHFAALKSKYQATKYENSSPSSVLYLILRKVDLGIEITALEFDWLKENELVETLVAIKQEQQHKLQQLVNLGVRFSKLQSKYKATNYNASWKNTPLYYVLLKLDSENSLNGAEAEWLRAQGFSETYAIFQEMKLFIALKAKYKATKYRDSLPDSRLYKIIKKIDNQERLTNSEVNWLKNNELWETLDFFQQQESAREAQYANLKDKYQATKHPDKSISSPLYLILQNLDADKHLSESELNWLKQHELTETLDIILEIEQKRDFAQLKTKYKATQYEDSSPSSHLYKVLKRLDLGNVLREEDINFLKKRKLTDTIAIAKEKYTTTLKYKIDSGESLSDAEIDWLKNNERQDIITFAQQKHFAILKSKYDVSKYKDKSPSCPLYTILQKLEKEERLEATDVAWLQANEIEIPPAYQWWEYEPLYTSYKLFSGKILIAYHTIEAKFYEQEFKRTGNKWNLPNASSHWRKADEPQRALQLTNNLELDKIKENKLKSALLTSRGGAFRDINKLDKAADCAKKAIEYYPKSHHPYTLMGAICFELGKYLEGEHWFQEAIKRGANPRDMDSEIKRVVKNAKNENKRREVVEYLLKKDPIRYAWAKSYLNKTKDKG